MNHFGNRESKKRYFAGMFANYETKYGMKQKKFINKDRLRNRTKRIYHLHFRQGEEECLYVMSNATNYNAQTFWNITKEEASKNEKKRNITLQEPLLTQKLNVILMIVMVGVG